MIVDLSKNKKQEDFFNAAIGGAFGKTEYRNFFYGGGIRGGKTFVASTTLLFLAKYFPNSRWHIIRSDFPALQATTIPSIEKIINGSSSWGWNKEKANYFAYNRKSDGKIFFKGENITHDPEQNDFLGLETNGFLFEQIEELSQKTWNMALSRNGSWYIDNMPTPITLSTFNPTQKWIKAFIYEPWTRGELKAPYYFQMALPTDNPFVTAEQWSAWENLADNYKKQYIEGNWDNLNFVDNRWAFSFDSKKHCMETSAVDKTKPLYLSFDFNIDPITCLVAQHTEKNIEIKHEYRLRNSNINDLCSMILKDFPNYHYKITGDATGQASNAMVSDNINYYRIIMRRLNVMRTDMNVLSKNPRVTNTRVLVNSILEKHPSIKINPSCHYLIEDLKFVEVNEFGDINKTKDSHRTHLLDCFRYYLNTYHAKFLMTNL